MWGRLRMGVLRMYKTFKQLYENEFGKSEMKHVKRNIMTDTFDNVITLLNSLFHGDKKHIQTQTEFIVRYPTPRRRIGT